MPEETRCLICNCTESRACHTDTGPCGWITRHETRQVGICSNCIAMKKVIPRYELERFATIMEARLLVHDHKGGWAKMSSQTLLLRVVDNIDGIHRALQDKDVAALVNSTADAANYLMMMFDNLIDQEEQANAKAVQR